MTARAAWPRRRQRAEGGPGRASQLHQELVEVEPAEQCRTLERAAVAKRSAAQHWHFAIAHVVQAHHLEEQQQCGASMAGGAPWPAGHAAVVTGEASSTRLDSLHLVAVQKRLGLLTRGRALSPRGLEGVSLAVLTRTM